MQRLPQVFRLRANPLHRSAFTLIELMVVITVMLILTTITVMSVNFSNNADRMRAGARQMQSLLGGARDKAIYAKEIRGLRLLLDPNDNHAVSAVQYIGSPERDTGVLTFDPRIYANPPTLATESQYGTDDDSGMTVFGVGTRWQSLKRRGFLKVGSRIQIPRDTGTWYTVSAIDATLERLTLNRANRDRKGSSAQVSFALELGPGILGDSQPVQFPAGVVIDLDGSQVPIAWRPSAAAVSYQTQTPMDILFTPRGTVIGDCATLGMIHLHFADAGDVLKWHQIGGRSSANYTSLPFVPADDPAAPANTPPVVARDRILVTLGTRTGAASVFHVDVTNTVVSPTSPIETNKLADDPFRFAETGEVANK